MDPGHKLAMALREAYWKMHRSADACLQPLGITANQFVLLALLAERDGCTQRDLVERASSDANTVRAMLVGLETKGLIERSSHPTDGRARQVRLSSQGRRTFNRLWSASQSFRDGLQSTLSSEEIATLLELLNQVTQTMAKTNDKENAATRGELSHRTLP